MVKSMLNKQCVACGQPFQPHPQVPRQSYCSAVQCQRARRQEWQRLKLKNDPDYQDNQTRAQQAWARRNPEYWRQYRESHPEYVGRNRSLQQERRTLAKKIAKMDVSSSVLPLPEGTYHLKLAKVIGAAKMDVWTVEIRVYVCERAPRPKIAKR